MHAESYLYTGPVNLEVAHSIILAHLYTVSDMTMYRWYQTSSELTSVVEDTQDLRQLVAIKRDLADSVLARARSSLPFPSASIQHGSSRHIGGPCPLILRAKTQARSRCGRITLVATVGVVLTGWGRYRLTA